MEPTQTTTGRGIPKDDAASSLDDVTGIPLSCAELRRKHEHHYAMSADTSSRADAIEANQNSRGGCGIKTAGAVAAFGGCVSLNTLSTAMQDKEEQPDTHSNHELKAQAAICKIAERLRILDMLRKKWHL
ncbi:hypothetical protein MHU86_24231 [Fragilaria crotonensis]|nr:hypothetical protein MHU86_24231 [Fragilaria crotonensis]